MHRTDVAVVGAGPGGMAAALAAADAGAQVTLLDEYSRSGGQYFKRASDEFSLDRFQLGRDHDGGETMRRALAQHGIRVLTSTTVWGVFDRNTLMLYREGRSEALQAGALVLATGAYDRPVAFPGWTLPGVMTAGGAQTLAKTQWVKPGRRVLLSGSGPFLLPVARQLLRVGVEIVAILEATSPSEWWRHALSLWGQWPRFAEAWSYWRALREARVPVLCAHKVIRALGDQGVEGAVIAEVDAAWRAIPGTEKNLRVDAIATGYGFLPNIDLAEVCGCGCRWDPNAATWFVNCSPTMATSKPGVFAAGEITGIGGSAIAQEEGRLAGISAAEHIGAITPTEARARRKTPMARRAQLARFADMLNVLFGPRPGLWEGLDGSTTACRCEEVTAAEVRACMRSGCSTPKAVKDWTRAGMGLCQGRTCRSLITQLIVEETGASAENVPRPRVRPPIKPVPIEALAQSEAPEGESAK